MSGGAIAGGTMLSQAVSLLHTQTSMIKMAAESEQAVANLLAQGAGMAQSPGQAVTPAAAPGKGGTVDISA
ncbi:hypothetical protein [Roseospira visakhapatnamensis]|uniref:Uncharacterized protein n=1 Tax=Roseospira visakhapatnamensis TaxID=390880 RepID=A0A7W6RBT1_9PROT|nr:hypothetical protein [Roseospira visakhapatnamensis]MBB4265515.1 hypothetical protein [Roseospira visakhapatnamensis]